MRTVFTELEDRGSAPAKTAVDRA